VKPTVAITVGDYNGIGPEVTLRAIVHPSVRRKVNPLLVGPAEVFERRAESLGLQVRFGQLSAMAHAGTSVVRIAEPSPAAPVKLNPGHLSFHAGAAAGAAIREGVRLTLSGTACALVTAPVSKHALHLAGIHVPGQTELLQRLTASPHVAMMLVSKTLRVGLVTIHVPIRRVPHALTQKLLHERVTVIHRALREDWRIRSPRLAILGLNPHAGESGDIGHEEQRVILPVLVALRRSGMLLDGPFPADAFFGRFAAGIYDAVVAMYHDQGLIPLKMSAGGRAVNVSVGLPIVRTSPDHGTAFDIAGRGKADPASMIEAILLAVTIAENRRKKRPRGNP